MMVLVSYDVSTKDKNGKMRLRKVAKECQNYGQHVQNSVFEIDVDYGSFLKVKDKLLSLVDIQNDSLRFYYLGKNWHRKVEHFGAKRSYDPEGVILI
jgi:CRISPR-associated protein Cas2